MSCTVKIFQIDKVDFIAAESKEEAIEYYKTIRDVYDDTPIRELTQVELDTFKFVEAVYSEDYNRTNKTFREKLAEMISAGEKFPTMFASSEW